MKNLFKSLADFQQEVPTIHKGTKGYGYSYADLPTIFETINPLLKKHGLGFCQKLETIEGDQYINTVIFHVESGETIDSKVAIPKVTLKGMNDYQSFGSGVTYYRRYALSSALGLVTDVDNDASGEQTKQTPSKQPNKKKELTRLDNNKQITKEWDDVIKAINDGKVKDVDTVRKKYTFSDEVAKDIQLVLDLQNEV